MREAISYEFDDFRLDVKRRELQQNGIPVSLTHKAYQVLLILVQNSEQTVEKEYIYRQLWGDSFVEDANLTQYIYLLRKTLGKTRSGESFIETVSKTGYRFVAKVRPIFPNSVNDGFFRPHGGAEPALKFDSLPIAGSHLRLAATNPQPKLNDGEVADDPAKPSSNSRSIWYRKRSFAISAIVILAGSMIVALIFLRPVAPAGTVVRSVAVLPFKPIGDASQNDKLGLGMADSIITRLSKLQQIPIRPTSSIVRYTDAPASNSIEAGREMGVDTVVEGTVQHEGERVRVSVKLIEVSTGRTLWAENFDESYTNIFSVQDSISQKVVRALAINLTQQQQQLLSEEVTTNVEALRAYQMGVYLYSTRTKENLNRSIRYFDEAIGHDPSFARAYALEADAYNMLRYYRFADPVETREKATALVNKALELNSEIPEAYIALANLQMIRQDGSARRSIEKAIALSPFNGTARLRYGWLLVNSDVNAASEQMRLAQEYDPLSAITNGAYCNVLIFQDRYDEAIKYCERAVELGHDAPSNRILYADALSLAGRHDEAIAQINRRIGETTGAERLTAKGSLADYLIRAGRAKEAESIYKELKAALRQHPEVLGDLVIISYALGRPDDGLAYFERAFKENRIQIAMLNHYPIWRKVNSDQRISALIERIRKERAQTDRS